MKKSDLPSTLPDSPGVYFFLGSRKEILYIGKATSLRSRVQSYFDAHIEEKRSRLIKNMIEESVQVSYTKTDSVLEALLVETNLIRTHAPRYNTRSKDNKSYYHVVITKDDFPRVLIVRGKDLKEFDEDTIQASFGPFPNATLFKEAMRMVRKLFQVYDEHYGSNEKKSSFVKSKIDFNRQLGLYPQRGSKTAYRRSIQDLQLFFEGKKDLVIERLTAQMKQFAKKHKFEEANVFKKRIFALQHINDVSLLRKEVRDYSDANMVRIEAYDVAHLDGKDMLGAMVVILGSERAQEEYRMFKIRGFTQAHDIGALTEMLNRRLTHAEWQLPYLIVVDGSTPQLRAAEKVLNLHKLTIPVVAVVKDEHHKPVRLIGLKSIIEMHSDAILLGNAEAHRFSQKGHRKLRNNRFIDAGLHRTKK